MGVSVFVIAIRIGSRSGIRGYCRIREIHTRNYGVGYVNCNVGRSIVDYGYSVCASFGISLHCTVNFSFLL